LTEKVKENILFKIHGVINLSDIQYWAFMHSPGQYATEEESLESVKEALRLNCALMQYEYGKGFQPSARVTHTWRLIYKLNEGDYIFLRSKYKIHAVGKIIRPRKKPDVILNMKRIFDIDKKHGEYRSDKSRACIHFDDNQVFYEDLSGGKNGWGQRVDVESWMYPSSGIELPSGDSYLDSATRYVLRKLKPEAGKKLFTRLKGECMGKEAELLEANKNLILTGAPGTGKTYLAYELARKLLFGKKEESELSEEEKKAFKYRCGFVQFHPSYDYTDFVEGLRPTKPDENGNIGFKLTDGIFKEFCKIALEPDNADKNFVFIIDEINRGEISKIFGELFFSVDPDYRGGKIRVQTQYQNMVTDKDDPFFEGFYVPKNVFIIGTMNDIDRSVESIDFAMRRRFSWVEITADKSAENMNLSQESKDRMKALNDGIAKTDGLGSAFQIGGSYFLVKENGEIIMDRQGDPKNPDYKKLWEFRLEPLIKEYLRGHEGVVDKLESLKKAYNNKTYESNGQ